VYATWVWSVYDMLEIEAVKELTSPFEIVEMKPCKDYYFAFEKWEMGKAVIKPRYPGAPPKKEVIGIRLHAKPGYKKYAPYYWDIFPKRLVYALSAVLPTIDMATQGLLIHRDVPGPGAHFGVRIVLLAKIPKPIAHP